MGDTLIAPYGSWKSPITSDLIVAGTVRLSDVGIDGEVVYWLEARPLEGGRVVVVRSAADGRLEDVTPPGFNVRSRVHEYGGGAYLVHDGAVFFSNFADQRLYRQDPGVAPCPITPEGGLRFADGVVDGGRGRIICICEDHSDIGREAVNAIAAVPLDGSASPAVLVCGNDFYATPRLSPDGKSLAWLTWEHPNMPWDGCELWVGDVQDDGSIGASRLVAGGPSESIFQPEWSPDGVLYFVSDRSNWWNLYRRRGDGSEPVWAQEAEFGLPQWNFRSSTYAFESADRLVCAYNREGLWRLAAVDLRDGTASWLTTPYTSIGSVHAMAGHVAYIGGSPSEPDAVVLQHVDSGMVEILQISGAVSVDSGYLSMPEAVEFPTEHELTAHGFFYRPRNRDYRAPEGERPPLLVMSHGGPTGATSARFDLLMQYWTSRGFAVLDVNYGGSTGYGREYRERLVGQWGVVDVDDCINGANYLVEIGEADEGRLLIRGGSAGGYTTLCALVFHSAFAAGASYYGVSDLEALALDTHKFEARYLDRLIGPYPEERELYYDRSPVHFADRLACPVIFFQGAEDQVVPPSQAEVMVEVLQLKGLPVAYVLFPGEQHGFRRAENIKRSLDAEMYFYSRVLGFTLAEPVEPVAIENLG
ncbi:MAG: S9 family peptidase [Anaerolineae bacterium]